MPAKGGKYPRGVGATNPHPRPLESDINKKKKRGLKSPMKEPKSNLQKAKDRRKKEEEVMKLLNKKLKGSSYDEIRALLDKVREADLKAKELKNG